MPQLKNVISQLKVEKDAWSVQGVSNPSWESRGMLDEKFRRRNRVLPNKINFSITKCFVFSLTYEGLETGGGGGLARWCEALVPALKSTPKVTNGFERSRVCFLRVSGRSETVKTVLSDKCIGRRRRAFNFLTVILCSPLTASLQRIRITFAYYTQGVHKLEPCP